MVLLAAADASAADAAADASAADAIAPDALEPLDLGVVADAGPAGDAASPDAQPLPPVPPPLAYWALDDADLSGMTVADLAGTADGTNNGATSGEPGRVRESFLFGGTGYVSIASESTFDFAIATSFSIAAWVRTATASGTQFVFGKAGNGGNNTPGFSLDLISTGSATLGMYNANGTSGRRRAAGPSLADDTWHHLVATYDGSNAAGGIALYVDGAPSAAVTLLDTPSGPILNDLLPAIGARADGVVAPLPFTGWLDEVAVWSVVLTSTDAANVYARGLLGVGLLE